MLKPDWHTMIFGVLIFCATLAAWLFGELHGVETTILWSVATPVILALFVGQGLADTAANARAAATQTNGNMDGRIKAAVSSALADRDAARTRQAKGDIA